MANPSDVPDKSSSKYTAEDLGAAYADWLDAKRQVAEWERMEKTARDAADSHAREKVKAQAEVKRFARIFSKVAANTEIES